MNSDMTVEQIVKALRYQDELVTDYEGNCFLMESIADLIEQQQAEIKQMQSIINKTKTCDSCLWRYSCGGNKYSYCKERDFADYEGQWEGYKDADS